jgi:predicted nucleotidyltransferase/uncharacterized protein (UPF0332 family)
MTSDNNIPEMQLNDKYKEAPKIQQDASQAQKEAEKTKKELEKLKTFIIKKFSYVKAISILPPQSIKFFIEEEEVPKETEKQMHINVIIPDEKAKEMSKIKTEIVKEIEKIKNQKIWLHLRTVGEVWEYCTDSKFEIVSAISMSYPLYDKGLLGGLRVAEIHKSLVLQKFEKYVVSYVIGGSLVRGETVKSSDVDVFVIINDTDVKRMPRLELKERLRSIIYQYVGEAGAMAGVQNKLEPQIYLLTDFWDAVKDAHPVMFTFIRDGVPLYDRGTFMPWKALLKMGKLKPSPEAIDMFMSMGDEVIPRSKKMMLSDVFTNIFWGVTTPAQALLMLYGLPPPNAKKELVADFKREFLNTKMVEKKYVDFLEKVIQTWRDYEHGKIKEMSGKEIDSLLDDMADYLKRMKELRAQIEKKVQEKTIDQIYNDVFNLLKTITLKKVQAAIIETFEKEFVKKGKFSGQHLRILRNVVGAKTDFKKGKLNSHKIDEARKEAGILINDLIEFSQRCDLVALEKGRMKLKYKEKGKDKTAELLSCDGISFLFKDNKILKLGKKVEESNMAEVTDSVERQKSKKVVEIDSKVFELVKKEIKDFEVII